MIVLKNLENLKWVLKKKLKVFMSSLKQLFDSFST